MDHPKALKGVLQNHHAESTVAKSMTLITGFT